MNFVVLAFVVTAAYDPTGLAALQAYYTSQKVPGDQQATFDKVLRQDVITWGRTWGNIIVEGPPPAGSPDRTYTIRVMSVKCYKKGAYRSEWTVYNVGLRAPTDRWTADGLRLLITGMDSVP